MVAGVMGGLFCWDWMDVAAASCCWTSSPAPAVILATVDVSAAVGAAMLVTDALFYHSPVLDATPRTPSSRRSRVHHRGPCCRP